MGRATVAPSRSRANQTGRSTTRPGRADGRVDALAGSHRPECVLASTAAIRVCGAAEAMQATATSECGARTRLVSCAAAVSIGTDRIGCRRGARTIRAGSVVEIGASEKEERPPIPK